MNESKAKKKKKEKMNNINCTVVVKNFCIDLLELLILKCFLFFLAY